MTTTELIKQQRLGTRIEWWLQVHNVPLYADLTTYYVVCCGFGFLKGLVVGTLMLRLLG